MEKVKDGLVLVFLGIVLPILMIYAGYKLYGYWGQFQEGREQEAYVQEVSTWSEEDEAKYARLLWDLYGGDFNALSMKEKEIIGRDMVEYFCVSLGCTRIPDVVYMDIQEEGVSGSYSDEENLIRIDREYFDDPQVDLVCKISVIAHECFHCHQHVVLRCLEDVQEADSEVYETILMQREFQDILAWGEDVENYAEIESDFALYYTSDLESSAREYGLEMNEKMLDEWTYRYSKLDEDEVRRKAENKSFVKRYTAETDWMLFALTALGSFVLGLVTYIRTGNRRFSVVFVLLFMAVFAYETIVRQSRMLASEHDFSLYSNIEMILRFALAFTFPHIAGAALISKEKSPCMENVVLYLAIGYLLLRAFSSPLYIAFCAGVLFLLFWPGKKRKKKVRIKNEIRSETGTL